MDTLATSQTNDAPPAPVGLVAALHGRITGVAELALAEARLAAVSVSLMVFISLLAAAFVLAAWGLAVAGMVVGMLAIDIPIWAALAGLGLLHALLAMLLWRNVIRLSRHLEFAATRSQMRAATGVEE